MDPLTAIGLLASISNLIEASNSLLDVVKSFKEGDKEFSELSNDVSIFAEALKGFNRVLRSRQTNHNISASVISEALEEAARTIHQLQDKLIHMSSYESSTMRRIIWVQQKSSLTNLHRRVKNQNTMLQSFLTLAHTYVTFWSIDEC